MSMSSSNNLDMHDFYDFIIVGNNIAALVAADTLSDRFKIALLNPAPQWGAHFGSTVIGGEQFDLGMNYFEFTTFKEQSEDIKTYNVNVRTDSARFFHNIEKYIRDILPVVEVNTPQMYVNGLFCDDLVIANRIESLALLSE